MANEITEAEPLYLATAELLDWSKGDTDEIYAFKVVRAARYDSLADAAREMRRLLRYLMDHSNAKALLSDAFIEDARVVLAAVDTGPEHD